jgi:RNA polymerase sigma-70 factor (ECF subfamily)
MPGGTTTMSAVPLPTQHTTAGFRARTTLDESPADRRMVSMAVARGKEGDREAIRYLYVRYSHNIYGYVRSIVHDEHEAEDITQHVFAKLMSILRKYDERGVPFSAWIIRVARNAALDHVRQRRPIPVEEVREHDAQAGDQTVHQHRSLMLRDALATLPEDQREVLVLRHVVGLSPGEIAERLGRTEPSIHGLHHRGRRALQAELTSRDSMPSTALLSAAA